MLARPLRPCACAHAPCVLMQGMFDDANALSDCNKRAIHDSFSQNSNWPYGSSPYLWGTLC